MGPQLSTYAGKVSTSQLSISLVKLITPSEDHRGTPEAPGRVATLIDRAHWETLTDHVRVFGLHLHGLRTYTRAARIY